jgi:hypothetical protein
VTPRALLLAATSAVGLLIARALDGLGLLPGVTESPTLRATALDPRWNALGLLGCLALGAVAAKLLPRAAVLSATVLIGGQVALVMALEETGRALSGTGGSDGGGDTGLWIATSLQVLLVVLSLTTALLFLALVPPVLGVGTWSGLVRVAGASAYRVVLSQAPVGGKRGRAPPVGVC